MLFILIPKANIQYVNKITSYQEVLDMLINQLTVP
jgi:hypothetical protein